MKTKTDYDKQATDFLEKCGVGIEIKLKKYGKHFDWDKDERAIYEITLRNGSRAYTFDFGQSLAKSYPYNVADHLRDKVWNEEMTGGAYGVSEEKYKLLRFRLHGSKDIVKNEQYGPVTAYDVLASVQKYDVGTLENFCNEMGLDTDSKKAEKLYNAVVYEYSMICTIFTESQLAELQEIQ